ncbi:MAG TPA: proton-conducting transporter membrane subunit, partial [Methylomirabilota bacterium]|nr:proton-conducting transporter membrane subunit [Methylomirabilota bacterium]
MTAAVYLLTALLGAAGAALGWAGMTGAAWSARVDWLVPLGGLVLEMDPLAGFFVVLVGAATVPVSIYAFGEAVHERRGALAYLVFVGAMLVVPLAANVMTFALAWELMSLASYVLVLDGARSGREARTSARAAWVYAVMTHAGLACLLAAMLLLTAWTGSTVFAVWRAAAPGLAGPAKNLAFVLLVLGFAGKAGVIPLHVWLPLAHPAAPSHVSALMSGVMIKLGVYGLMRASFDWLGSGPPWWGVVILLAGAVSALIGVLYALVDHDLKRLLAFHSIENVGIILIGLGAGMLYRGAGLEALALLGVAAALYHTVNHAAFKALLFLAAGAVVHATGTRDMERMGGLARRMPWTAACFLVGAAAIAALPPLNGFVSEWLTFVALLQSAAIPRPGINLAFAAGIAGLALTSGLAMACFVKAYGITFLALPRHEAAAGALEVGTAMRAGMVLFALACIALGLGPTLALPVFTNVAAALLATPAASRLGPGDWLTLATPGGFASLSTPAIAVALALAVAAPLAALRVVGAARGLRPYETWGCGRMLQTARMEYTATAFSSPFKRVFDFFYRPVTRLDIETHPESRFFVRRIEWASPTHSIFEDWLYRPALAAVH